MEKIMRTMEGNEAAAYVSYAFTEVAAIYPITPSSPMAELVDVWAAEGKKNLFGQEVKLAELQSEAGAAGTMHGSLQGGALTTTYTASQGLLLMIPNLYKMVGELLPGVFHVSARAIATHALSIFGDHQDVMAVRQTGAALLASGSVQEVMDLAGVAHLTAIKSRIPFVHFFDGFRTSHEVNKVEVIDYEDFRRLIDLEAVGQFRNNSLNPERPVIRGTAQNPDIYFQGREAANSFYEAVPDLTAQYMQEITKITGRDYKPFNYYGAKDARYLIVAMGSVCDTIEETIDYLVAKGESVGLIRVHLYRPFSASYFFEVYPNTVQKIAVLDRTKEPGAPGEPLYQDVRTLFYERDVRPVIVGGRYGLGSNDTTPAQIMAVYNNLKQMSPKNGFTIGIVDDVTHTSLRVGETLDTTPEGTTECKIWGLGSDGTVGANKMAIKIIGDQTPLYAQGYFQYDSKKSGGTTISYLRFGKERIKSSYLVYNPGYIACHNRSFVNHYDLLKGIKPFGTFVLNCPWKQGELEEKLSATVKRTLAKDHINFYVIDAVKIAKEIGLGGRINMVMQAVFFKLVQVIPVEEAVTFLEASIKKSYGGKGQKIIDMNKMAVHRGMEELVHVQVPDHWANAEETEIPMVTLDEPEFVKKIQRPMTDLEGDTLPVSAFRGIEDGTFPLGTTNYEKRGIAVMIPQWQPSKCIECNQCAYICPHAVIRPFLLDEKDRKNAPDTYETIVAKGKGLEGMNFRIQISPLDCTGCGNCADICPAPGKALIMVDMKEEMEKQLPHWEFSSEKLVYKDQLMAKDTVKGSQFAKPLLEFSGACGGCGETPYIKLITQLFGDRMVIANATGCSSIWAASAPSTAYTTNAEGKGPAWGNSLFEDNAEYGYGMVLAVKQIREKLRDLMLAGIASDIHLSTKEAFKRWIEVMNEGDSTRLASKAVIMAIEEENKNHNPILQEIIEKKDFLIKQSHWIVGGDGWAYDIGYGGLDQIIYTGEDVNILVFDTEIYSNTGGQASKSTPTAAAAKFAASGKKIRKKDLGLMATNYGYVYVAQISMGANMSHTLKVIREAESYKGPSLIICYAPCINHGISRGMGTSINQEKEAVESGYWHLYRFDPRLKERGENPFILDSKAPTKPFRDFIMSEVRFVQVKNTFPDLAEDLYQKAEADARDRYDTYRRLADLVYTKNE